jgi:zinc protease
MANTILAQDKILDRSKPPKAGKPKDVQFPDYFDTTLANGINLLVIENYKIPSVSVRLVFTRAGSFNDGNNFGLASFTADLLTKGTLTRTATQIAEDIDFLGANLSGGSDWDGSYVSLSCLKKHLGAAIDVLADVVQNPVFDEEEIKRSKEQRISSIIQAKDDPGSLSDKMFNKVVFDGQPYGNPSEGTEASINGLTKDNISAFYKDNYVTNGLIIAFVGAISKDEAIKLVNEKFKTLKTPIYGNETATELQKSKMPAGKVYIVNKIGAVQSNLRIGHTGISRNNPDYIAVSVMNTILGGYFSSRINYNLREKHGFTYGARSGFAARYFPGDFSVDADVRNEVTDSAVGLVIEELKRIVTDEVTDDEILTVKNYLTGVFPLQLETANAVASRVINLKMYGLPKDYYNKYISAINKITKKDILDAAKKYIHPENVYIVVSGDASVIKSKMAKFGEVEVYDADGNKIE